jgi:N utilization substance protein A
MQFNLNQMIEQVGRDKGIERNVIVEAIETAILTAARKKYPGKMMEAHFNEEMGEVEVFEFKRVVDTITEPITEITLDEAKKLDPEAGVGDDLGFKLDTRDLGRIAAQTAKQVIIQRVRDAERENVYNEYKDRKFEIVTGIARRFEKGDIIVDLGRAESILPKREQIPREVYRPGDRVQAYIIEVYKQSKGPQIVLSRTDTGLIMKLFEMEVPEIAEGIVKIECAAREPGVRAKIAVSSRDSDVDPIGACVGMRGARVQNIVQELRGEKIDIVPYHPDPVKFVCSALAPAQVARVIQDEGNRSMEIVVPDDQLSLAIGRKGQNVRLAAQLSTWKLDIMSETRFNEVKERALSTLRRIEGLSDTLLDAVYRQGFRSARDMAEAAPEELEEIPGIGPKTAAKLVENAKVAAETEEAFLAEEDAKKAAAEAEKAAAEAAKAKEAEEAAAAAKAAEAAKESAAEGEKAAEPAAEPEGGGRQD